VDVVIVAIDDQNLQREIYHQCQKRKILCNCVDLLDCCDFIFTAYIKKDDLVISINTNGAVPGLSAVLKNHIEKFIPSNIEQILNSLKEYRNGLAPGKARMKLVREKAERMLSEGDCK
jgi:precorrin-2 dehydrogenase/sirohydrochlorin ferrochelatase